MLPFQAEVKRLAAKETLLEDRAGPTRIFFEDRYPREFHNHFAGSDQSSSRGLHKTGLDLDASSLVDHRSRQVDEDGDFFYRT